MKTMMICLSMLLASPALAVVTKNCPKSIAVELQDLDHYSMSFIKKVVVERFGESEFLHERENLEIARRDFAGTDVLSASLRLKKAASGTCTYTVDGIDFEARFFTQSGKNTLRIPLAIGEGDLMFYAHIEADEYSQEGVIPNTQVTSIVAEVVTDMAPYWVPMGRAHTTVLE
jgi:hypothetical protein